MDIVFLLAFFIGAILTGFTVSMIVAASRSRDYEYMSFRQQRSLRDWPDPSWLLLMKQSTARSEHEGMYPIRVDEQFWPILSSPPDG